MKDNWVSPEHMTAGSHTSSIASILEGFVSSKSAGAIVLQGKWGIGKTHLWRENVIKTVLAKPWKKRYSYVSLFGVNSLGELKTALAIATEEFDQELKHDQSFLTRARKQLNKWQFLVPDAAAFVPKVGVSLARTIERIGFYLVRDRIICFDDIERKGDGLALKDFLGLVSFLVEQRKCRIVVVLNSGELDERDQATWSRMREKVFDGELTYQPSLTETVELGLVDVKDEPWCDALRTSLLTLSISNIRLVRRTVRFMGRAIDSCQSIHLASATQEHIAKALALMVFSVHGQGEDAPPIDLVMHRGFYALHFIEDKTGERSAAREKWSDLLSKYGLYLHSKLDDTLLAMVENGYPDSGQLIMTAKLYEASWEQNARKNEYYEAWRLYHDTVADNGKEIIAAFERAWPPVSASESPNNLHGVVRVMRLLGRSDLATKFIQNWVRERKDRPDELEPGNFNTFGYIDDKEIQDAVAEAREAAVRILPPKEAFLVMQGSEGYPNDAIASIAAASEPDLVQLLMAESGPDFTRTIKKLLNLPLNPAQPAWQEAAIKIRAVCQLIAASSPLNADRMKNWFDIEPVAPDARTDGA